MKNTHLICINERYSSKFKPCKATNPSELQRQIMSSNVPKNEREWWAKRRIEDLIDFAIWMTGCGYDFCQHRYFIQQRDLLLKNPYKDQYNSRR